MKNHTNDKTRYKRERRIIKTLKLLYDGGMVLLLLWYIKNSIPNSVLNTSNYIIPIPN